MSKQYMVKLGDSLFDIGEWVEKEQNAYYKLGIEYGELKAETRIAELEARVAALEGALKPFADAWDEYQKDNADVDDLSDEFDTFEDYSLKVWDWEFVYVNYEHAFNVLENTPDVDEA